MEEKPPQIPPSLLADKPGDRWVYQWIYDHLMTVAVLLNDIERQHPQIKIDRETIREINVAALINAETAQKIRKRFLPHDPTN